MCVCNYVSHLPLTALSLCKSKERKEEGGVSGPALPSHCAGDTSQLGVLSVQKESSISPAHGLLRIILARYASKPAGQTSVSNVSIRPDVCILPPLQGGCSLDPPLFHYHLGLGWNLPNRGSDLPHIPRLACFGPNGD